MIESEKPHRNCETCTSANTNTLFCSLGIEERIVFNSHKKDFEAKKGDILFEEGKYPKGIFIVYKGKIKISKLGDEGKEQIVRFAKSGDIIGYRALLSEESYRATATAITKVQLCHIAKEDFFKVLTSNRFLYKDIIKKLASDLRKAENRILSISQKTVRQRVAETLVILHLEFGSTTNNTIDVKLSRKDIGNTAGSTIESTIRTLSMFKAEGIIKIDGKDIIVKDLPKLINISNFKFSN